MDVGLINFVTCHGSFDVLNVKVWTCSTSDWSFGRQSELIAITQPKLPRVSPLFSFSIP